MATPRKGVTPRKSGIPPPRFSLNGRGTPRKNATPGKPRRRTPQKQISATPVQNDGDEQTCVVAIRMRPLNAKETTSDSENSAVASRVWKTLPQYNSITQTSSSGQPLLERVTGRTFFTFDKTFGEDATSADVYDGVAKNIVHSVVNGLNGTIFAYGQTSSGKTFTMQGSGSIEEGHTNGGGIVHMAAMEIFSHIQNNPNRVYLVRASFIEIYNEEIRDLLGNNGQTDVLKIREDPGRGVFVNANEEIVTDFESLLQILFSGDKNRTFAATNMNERSSRSHTVLRITIESRQKDEGGNDENSGDISNGEYANDGAVRVSTLNLVDLAGSESVRHTGASGDRQKEGGRINQSLLTLSRVIVALGQPNQTHINFRDSKLTRILQPSLSGNAKMAVICCATPSQLYLEETRSTLLFASRAKLVKTRAQVNEVLDDRAMIKKLQRELVEARRQGGAGPVQTEDLQALKTEVAQKGSAARKAEELLKRLKASLLNNNVLFATDDAVATNYNGKEAQKTRKRRKSDGELNLTTKGLLMTPLKDNAAVSSPQSEARLTKKENILRTVTGSLSPSSELIILREAFSSKIHQVRTLGGKITETERDLESTQSELATAHSHVSDLHIAKNAAKEESAALTANISLLVTEHSDVITQKEETIRNALNQFENETSAKASVEAENADLRDNLRDLQAESAAATTRMTEIVGEQEQLQIQFNKLSEERVRSAFQLAQANSEKENFLSERTKDKQSIQDSNGKIEFLMTTMQEAVEDKDEALKVNENIKIDAETTRSSFLAEKVELESNLSERSTEVVALQSTVYEQKNEMELLQGDLQESTESESKLTGEIISKNEAIEQLQQQLGSTIEENAEREQATQKAADEFEKQCEVLRTEVNNLQVALGLESTVKEKLATELEANSTALDEKEATLEMAKNESSNLRSNLADVEGERDKLNSQNNNLSSQLEQLTSDKTLVHDELTKLAAEQDITQVSFMELDKEKSIVDNKLIELTLEIEERTAKMQNTEADHQAKYEQVLKERDDGICEGQETNQSLQEALTNIDGLQEDIESSNVTHESIRTQLDEVQGEKTNLMTHVDDLQSKQIDLVDRLEEAKEHVEALTAAREDITKDLAERDDTIATLTEQLNTTVDNLQKKQESLEETELKVDNIEANMTSLQSDLKSLHTQFDDVSDENNDGAKQVEQLMSEKVDLTSSLAEAKEHIEALTAAKGDITKDLAERDASVVELTEECEIAAADAQKKEESLEEAEQKIDNIEATMTSLQSNLQSALAELDKTSSENGEMVEQTKKLVGEKLDITSRLEEATSRILDLSTEKENIVAELSERNTFISQLKKESDEIQCTLQEHKLSLEKSGIEVEELEAQIGNLESERDLSLEKLQVLALEKSDSLKEIELLQTEKSDLDTLVEEANAYTNQLTADKEVLADAMTERDTNNGQVVRERDDAIRDAIEKQCSLDEAQKKVIDLQTTIGNLKSDVTSVQMQLKAVSGEKSNVAAQIDDLHSEKHNVENQLEAVNRRIDGLMVEKEVDARDLSERDVAILELIKERDEALLSIQQKVHSLDGAAIRIEELETHVTNLQSRLSENESTKVITLEIEQRAEHLEKELDDTRLLLASANDSVKEAREAALAADDELEDRERRLGDALCLLSERDEALSSASDQMAMHDTQKSSSDEDLLREMEALMEEKLQAEARLETEKAERKVSENELKQLMGEEQRELLQEGETMMSKLRNQVAELEATLSQTEADAYAARQEVDDLLDQNKRIEMKALEVQQEVSSSKVETENSRKAETRLINGLEAAKTNEKDLTLKISELKTQKNRLKSQLENAKKDLIRQGDRSAEESASMTSELSRIKAESYSSKQEMLDLRDEINSFHSDREHSNRNSTVLCDKVTKLETLVKNLEAGNKKLQDKLYELEASNQSLSLAEKKKASTAELEKEVEELINKIKRKDERVKKLEAVSLTKAQVEKMVKTKAERAQYFKEVTQYKKKLVNAENEIESLKARPSRSMRTRSSGANDDDDMSELIFAKQALETKLRKYASHCQRLEGDRVGIVDALKASNRHSAADGNVANAVFDLCDKVSSLEEECEALTSAEGRASSYLVEMDRLREEKSQLEERMSHSKDCIARLTNLETELSTRLGEAQLSVSALRDERDQLRNVAERSEGDVVNLETEKTRQVRYLEQENLQLMLDLKATKKQLQSSKTELNTLHLGVLDDNTEDFGSISTGTVSDPSTGSAVPQRAALQSLNDKENVGISSPPRGDPKSAIKGSTKKRSIVARIARSSRKKRIVGTPGNTVGLGDVGPVNDDNTGECNQS